jgi:hypothetical protein
VGGKGRRGGEREGRRGEAWETSKGNGSKIGAVRELNPGPPVPETGIIPLDQPPVVTSFQQLPLNPNSTPSSPIAFPITPILGDYIDSMKKDGEVKAGPVPNISAGI